jgi:hypothetical protein
MSQQIYLQKFVNESSSKQPQADLISIDPAISNHPTSSPSSLNMGRSLALIVVVMLVLLVLVNIPFDDSGAGLAQLLPQASFGGYLYIWWWLAAGVALAWGLGLVWRSFSQAETEVVGEEQLQGWLDQARRYQAQINHALKSTPNKSRSLYGPSLAAQVNAWVELIQELIQRLALLRRDDLIRQELVEVPKIITALETQLAHTADASLRSHLEQALAHRRQQLVLLRGLQSKMQQAEIQIENTLSLLSAIYSQILTGQSIRHIANYKHLLTNLDEEVCRLQDQLEALHEFQEDKFSRLTLRSQIMIK